MMEILYKLAAKLAGLTMLTANTTLERARKLTLGREKMRKIRNSTFKVLLISLY